MEVPVLIVFVLLQAVLAALPRLLRRLLLWRLPAGLPLWLRLGYLRLALHSKNS